MVFDKEPEFEKALITLLFDKGWSTEVLKYKTEADLIENWKQILFENNRDIDRLNDAPLTDGEMQQIMEQIKNLRTPVRLNGFINGKTVAITRDNPNDPAHFGREVYLKIYDRQEIAAGQSRYQIAEQPKFRARSAMLNDRRGDFMLLINGMPVIHVELKKSGIPVSQAVEQIKKYAHEGVFTGLFSLVQIFAAMNPDETLYFANPGPDGRFNEDYYFHWADFYNQPMNDWQQIAEHLLSIPMAHEMIGFYNVADDTDASGYKPKDIQLINRKRIVFIVDECHRDVFGEMMRKIKETFPMAMFFGFTGTPIYTENQKKLNTTVDVFGNELHRYSVADGIRDKNVLGFDPTMVMTYKDRELRRAVALFKAKAQSEEEVALDPRKEAV